MIDLLKKLCLLNGTSGREDEVRNFIINEIKDYADSLSVDNLGNLIVFKKGRKRAKNKIMLDAHMDEVAFMITCINSDGTLSFESVGGINTAVMTGIPVSVGKDKISGVIGVLPIHLAPKDKKQDLPVKSSLCIDIGAASNEEARKGVSPGDCAYFDSDFVQFGDGYLKSKALDDRAGCAMLITLIKEELEYDAYFTFSAGEEVGYGAAGAAAFTVKPDYAIVCETTTAADLAGVDENKKVCRLKCGGAVSFMDRRTVYSKDMFDLALDTANKLGIPAQPKTMVAGGNNAGHIHKTAGGIKTVTVSVPCRYLHSPSCVVSVDDVYSSLNLVRALIGELADA